MPKEPSSNIFGWCKECAWGQTPDKQLSGWIVKDKTCDACGRPVTVAYFRARIVSAKGETNGQK